MPTIVPKRAPVADGVSVKRMRLRWVIGAGGVGLFCASVVAASLAAPAKVKKLGVTSPAFGNNAPIPSGFTCEGDNASPPLKLGKTPRGTKDRALIMTDPDAPSGTLVHWVAWNLPSGGVPQQ